MRDRLKEAKGIGTPATRAEIIKGLKRQSLLAADGKFVVPTSAGLQIFELLRGAAPSLVDPATTATWEMQLDDIVSGRTDFRVVIDGIAAMAGQLIEVLRGTPASAVDLSPAAAAAVRGRRQPRAAARRRPSKEPSTAPAPHQRRSAKHTQPTASAGIVPQKSPHDSGKTGGGALPTAKMVAYAKSLAGNKKVKLPPGYAQDFETCRRFLDQHSR